MIVVNSSFFLARVFSDEENALVADVFDAIARAGLEALAPGLFFYEIHNGLVTAVRRKRIKKSQISEYLKFFSLAPVTVG